MNTLGIYIHVPFCAKKCEYCDFYSVSYSKKLTELYTDAVIRNLQHYSDKSRITDTLYFGGGTPSLLRTEQIVKIMNSVRDNFILDENAEITIEANPNTLTPEKLKNLRGAGINRISLGVQSMIDDELKLLGRKHSTERAVKAVNDAVNMGFDNISCDLMIALPNQTMESLEYSIKKMSELPIQHISAYILKIEEGTPFEKKNISSLLPDEDSTADMYMRMSELLEEKGFSRYEVSNFAKKGFESRHNSRYWKCLDYISIGPSAHSCCNGKRFAVGRDIEGFISSDIQPIEITDENPCGFEEFSMLRLRLAEGLNLSDVESHRNEIIKKVPDLIKAGYINFDGENISLTSKGFLMSNSVIEYLVF